MEEGEVVKEKFVPTYEGELRKHALEVPRCISECSGIRVFGRRIKSLVFSTDVAIIKNINADAVIAVYNFTPQPSITQAIISVSDVPVFAGVGGGYTNGQGPPVAMMGSSGYLARISATISGLLSYA